MALQIETFEGSSFSEIKEKFNWFIDTGRAKSIVNVSMFQPRFDGEKHEIVILYDNEGPRPQVQSPVLLPSFKGRA